jgi:hypothetical protein
VIATTVYATLFALLVVWLQASTTSAELHAFLTRPRLVGVSAFHVVTVANAAWIVLLALDLGKARRAPPIVRRAHVAGVLLAALVVGALQLLLVAVIDATETLSGA